MKKTMAIFGSVVMLATGATIFAACNNDQGETKTVMNLSCNPSIELVLDANDKVISANALNEEGNLVISAEVFTGKTAEEAASLFVQVSKETGFLVSGNANIGGNELSVSFSGDVKAAEKLYQDVKAEVEKYLSAENISVTIAQAEAITEAQLQALVAECAPYMKEAEIKALEYMELVEMLYESRKETAEYYSQELKNAYYEAKAFALEQAELEVLRGNLNVISQSAFDLSYQLYTGAIGTIENTRKTMLVDENSVYQQALKDFRAAKIEYLKFRKGVAEMTPEEFTDAVEAQLQVLDSAVDVAEKTLLAAGESANAALNVAKTQITTAYDALVAIIKSASVKVSDHLKQISTKQKEAITAFTTEFESDYAAAVTAAKTGWADMKTALQEKAAE